MLLRILKLIPFCVILSLLVINFELFASDSNDTKRYLKPPAGKIFRFRLPFETVTLDWNTGDIPILIIQNAMRGLYKLDGNGKVVPDLVDSATTLKNGKVWIFNLKSGIKWSDGIPLNALHFVESFKRLLDPNTASSYAYFLYDIEGAEEINTRKSESKEPTQLGIRILSDHSFEIRLKRSVAYLPALLTHWVTYPIRPDLIKRWKDIWTNPSHLATLGPFKITEWRPQLRIVMEKNPYAEKKPWFNRVEGWVVLDDSTANNLYETNHLEFMTDPSEDARTNPDLISRPSPIQYFIGVGPGHPLTTSRAGVLALSAAIDRTEIPKLLDAPHRPASDYIPPEIWKLLGSPPESNYSKIIPLKGDPVLAKTFLKEAGFESGSKVPLLVLKYFNRPDIAKVAEWLQGQWKKNLGLQVTLDGREPKTYWTELAKNPAHLFLNSKGASYPDPDAFFRLFEEKGPQNLGQWSNSEFEKLVSQARTTTDAPSRRNSYVLASQKLLLDQPGIIPLYFRNTRYMMKPFVKGLVINPLTSVYLDEAKYQIETGKLEEEDEK